jgi:uncharacterized membrane protein YbhN (UPF0104 family)
MSNTVPPAVVELMGSIATEILNPVMGVIFAAALVYCLWGMMTFIFSGGDETKLTLGKQNMFWGVIGMTIMVSTYAIILLALNSFGVTQADVPAGLPLYNQVP